MLPKNFRLIKREEIRMKKTLLRFSSLILVMSLVVSLGVFMTGCGNSSSGNKQVKITFCGPH